MADITFLAQSLIKALEGESRSPDVEYAYKQLRDAVGSTTYDESTAFAAFLADRKAKLDESTAKDFEAFRVDYAAKAKAAADKAAADAKAQAEKDAAAAKASADAQAQVKTPAQIAAELAALKAAQTPVGK